MRLDRNREILAYLGQTPRNWRAWTLVKLHYGSTNYRLSLTSADRGYWARSEELDAIDRDRDAAIAEYEYDNLLRDATTYRQDMRSARRRGAIG